MKVHVTGKSGFVGQHVVAQLASNGHDLCDLADRPRAMIHLAWKGLPNYESEAHFDNVEWQWEMIRNCVNEGINNVTVAGTCLEVVANPPPYALAKTKLRNLLAELPIILKWVRLPYLYGPGQRGQCLLPSLNRAIARGDKVFHVTPVSLPFMQVREAAERIVNAMEDERNQVANCCGMMQTVKEFCESHMPLGAIELVEDYPVKPWEK